MSNVESIKTKEVKINIDGKDYIVKYTLSSFAKLEELYGSIDAAMNKIMGEPVLNPDGTIKQKENPETGEMEDERNVSVTDMINFIWIGFRVKQPELTKEDVGDLITFDNMKTLMPIITSAFSNTLPKQEDDGKN